MTNSLPRTIAGMSFSAGVSSGGAEIHRLLRRLEQVHHSSISLGGSRPSERGNWLAFSTNIGIRRWKVRNLSLLLYKLQHPQSASQSLNAHCRRAQQRHRIRRLLPRFRWRWGRILWARRRPHRGRGQDPFFYPVVSVAARSFNWLNRSLRPARTPAMIMSISSYRFRALNLGDDPPRHCGPRLCRVLPAKASHVTLAA